MAKKKAKNYLSSRAYTKGGLSSAALPRRQAGLAKGGKFKDSDADGLFDIDEKKLGTNPKKRDSDNDGLNDYEEVQIYGTDPLNPDTDKDGIKDGDEVKRGQNPKGPGRLKDLFIPNIFNNFKPQSLHPKRIIFYSLSAILFKAILVITVMVLPIEAWLTPDILVEQSRKVISLTNTIRKNLNLALLTESPPLNQAAYQKAEDMLLSQYFSHIGPDSKTLADWLKQTKYNFTSAGENLAMGFASPEEVVNGWTRSQTHYQNMIDPDFEEIGVGMISGLYAQVDTTLVAEYFGAPAKQTPTPSEIQPVKPTPKPPVKASPPAPIATTTQLLGERVNETPKETQAPEPSVAPKVKPEETKLAEEIQPIAETQPERDIAPPQVDQSKSKLYIDQPQGQSESIVRAEVYLTSDAVKAQINFNNYFISLKPVVEEPGTSATLGTSKWVGQTIIFKEDQEQIFNPVVLASITAEDQAGNRTTVDLPWNNIKPAETTLLKQYYFIKQHQSQYTQPLFDVTSIFYKIILIIALIALALNIFIQIKKQYPRVIFSTLGLIALLVILIII